MAERNRMLVLAATAVVGATTGSLQMWSVFNLPLREAHGWSSQEVALAFSLFTLSVCIAGFLAGKLQEKVSSRTLVLASGMMLAAGWFLAGNAQSITELYLAFSVLGGFGDGIIYNTAIAVATRWFPDKRGFANGVIVGLMGLAPLAFSPFSNALIQAFDVTVAFWGVAAVILAAILAFGWMVKDPPGFSNTAEPAAEEMDAASMAKIAADEMDFAIDKTPLQMMRTPLFWAMWIVLVCAATSGTMMLGHASNIAQEGVGLNPTDAASLVGIMAVANFVGRFGFGSLSDKIGRHATLLVTLGVTAIDMLFFFGQAYDLTTYAIVLCVVAACYGGTMVVMPSMCGDSFGSKHFGQNYAVLFTGYTAASFVGPMLAATAFEASGSYGLAFIIAGGLACVGVVLTLLAWRVSRKPAHLQAGICSLDAGMPAQRSF